MAMLACIGTAQAQQISVEDAQTIAQQWLTRGEKNARVKMAAQPVRLAHTMKSTADDATNLYVFNRTGDGFVIIAGDERVGSQILGFSDEGEFNPDYMPDALRDLMGEYNEQIDVIKKIEPEVSHNGRGPKQATSSQIKYPQFHDVTDVHGPLLTTFWIQDAPYNWEIARKIAGVENPEGMTEEQLDAAKVPPTGCTVTALCQIMNYHKWPEKGTGSFSYKEYRGIHSDPTNGTNIHTGNDISSNFADHTYDWEHMRNAYEGTYEANAGYGTKDKYNKAEGNAVAQLMYDVGVSLRTRYGRNAANNGGKDSFSGSGAHEYYLTEALVKYFGYASTLKAVARGNISPTTQNYDALCNYSDKEWEDMLINEIDNKRPVFMCGGNNDNSESHSYVCDGYAYGKTDKLLYFHVNWGWGQYGTGSEAGDEKHLYMYNGYFRSTAFTYHSPYYDKGSDKQKDYVWAYKQFAIIGIQPDKGDYWYDWTDYSDNINGKGGTYKHKQVFSDKDVNLKNLYGRLSKDGKYRELKVGDWGRGLFSTNGVEAHFIINNETGEVVTPPFYTGYDYNGNKVYAASPEQSPLYNSYWTPRARKDRGESSADWKGKYEINEDDFKKLTLNLGYYYENGNSYSRWNADIAPDELDLVNLNYKANVSSANISTLFLDYNTYIPDNVKVYYVTDNNDGKVKFNKLEGEIIPQGVPVVIQAEQGEYMFSENNLCSPTDDITGNLLKGTISAHKFTDAELKNVYFLQVQDSSPVFNKAKSSGTDAEMTIAAHKAWLEYPTSSASGTPNQLTIDGFTTDIQRLIDDADMGSAKRYNLAGQQVGNDYHGIVIVNGKKYLR